MTATHLTSRTVPDSQVTKTEGRTPIQCYGYGTPGVVKSKCPTCTRANEMETGVNCKVIPTEFLVLPETKGNKALLGLDFLNAAGIVLDIRVENGTFPKSSETVQILQEDIRRYNTQRILTSRV
ncbi:hypothetical protein TNCV_1095281 [Trichonephila clavipes]|nr:hypothetical protein TNCV_1095281 [Trichonephila clavipes]